MGAELLLGKHPWPFSSEEWPKVFDALAAKLGRPNGPGKAPLMVGVSAQDIVGGGMWKDAASAKRNLTHIPAQAQDLVNRMCRWRHGTRIPPSLIRHVLNSWLHKLFLLELLESLEFKLALTGFKIKVVGNRWEIACSP